MDAQEKILIILRGIKGRWDSSPKIADETRYGTFALYNRDVVVIKIPRQSYLEWCHEARLDYEEFKDILGTLKQEGLIFDFDFQNEAR